MVGIAGRSIDQIRAEIEDRFGFFPPFFTPALDRAATLDNLWQQTLRSYIDNTLPSLWLEQLFAVLSRYCDVPYCLVCHSCALRPLGMDATAILRLLDGPGGLPDPEEAATVLTAAPADLAGWAQPGPVADAAMRATVSLFLRDGDRDTLAPLLRRVVPAADMDQLVMFLGYVTTCLEWVEAHPELSVEADLRAMTHLGPLLAEQPALGRFFADYTRRRRTAMAGREAVLAERVAQADRRFTLAFDHAPIGMALVGLGGTFLRVNESLCRMLGRSADILAVTTFAELTHPDDLPDSLRCFSQMIVGDIGAYQADKRYRHADGGWITVQISAALLRAGDGSPLQFVTLIEDVSESRAQAARLEAANAELQRSNRDLEQFAAMAAHELKGPLAVVAGLADFLVDDIPDDAPECRHTATRIAAAATRMTTFVDDLLAYARAGTEELRVQWVDVDAMLREILAEMGPHLQAGHTRVRLGHLGGVWAHPTHLRQVFVNLISNAVKYTAPGSRPTVEITVVEYDDDVVYTIADSGLGVPADARETIFDMFHREHRHAAAGTGVGLAICHRIIERHGGRIWVEARPGGGSLFRIRLPRYPTTGATPRGRVAARARGAADR
ncbi:sensor histidine kinase [Actinoplanes teichomyceticus]|uniref:histidine kinase n=1 Tax=Actinoplanes teichomyceticus TaxID=1867 RepID=A0A561VM49_ACTTI|nr:HAMP domain-containing sensor histidine kinase [Actinoplanes teichomyceticus]TWG12667.1 PAS domain S-box-containing protein [Actinoplanes teichomyceticus]GIF13400.1 hypothetical protein Ate01nite_34320 [Actinoplanes teichomyceticus]